MLERREALPTDLIIEERERGLFVALDRAGVVVDRTRDRERMADRATSMIVSLGADRLAGRVVNGPAHRIVLLPTAAIQLAAVQAQVERAGGDVPAELGWELDDLTDAVVVAGAAEPFGSTSALAAAIAGASPADDHGQARLDEIVDLIGQLRSAHQHLGPPKDLRSLLLSE